MTRKLTAEEEALWRRVGKDVRQARAPRHRLQIAPASPQGPLRDVGAEGPNPLRRARAAGPAFGGGDPARDRLAAQRRLPIEARLDLHGLTQRQAETALLRFLAGAHADGAACVIVITGKGKQMSGGDERRGVLKQRFLDAIETAPLRPMIARVAPAKPKDGGAGAFYVFLKKPRAKAGKAAKKKAP
jgi:DNA-nicking Smr family endonuclease